MEISKLYELYLKHPQITTDSRICPKDSIFIALRGENFDGNKFAETALERGCAYAIVDEQKYQKPDDSRYILVDNCLKTYQQLAREHRRRFHIPIIGITGTNGKTTTKELVSAKNTAYSIQMATLTTMWACQRRCSDCQKNIRLPSLKWVPVTGGISRHW